MAKGDKWEMFGSCFWNGGHIPDMHATPDP